MFKFIHCADLHLGVQFKGIKKSSNPHIANSFFSASFESWERTISLAISNEVDFILIAGDVFDSITPSLSAKIHFKNGLEKLDNANILAFIVTGNHDNDMDLFYDLSLPSNTKLFSSSQVETIELAEKSVKIHGISHDLLNYKEILAKKFSDIPLYDGFSIGLLHANIGSMGSNDSYSSTNLTTLTNSMIDYWALGHIHKNMTVKSSLPLIVYSGATQGKNINQDGIKGVILVEVSQSKKVNSTFLPTSSINFLREELDLSKISNFDELKELLKAKKTDYLTSLSGANLLFLELIFSGRTPINELLRSEHIDELNEMISSILGDKIFLNDLIIKTLSAIDELDLIKNNPILGDIFLESDYLTKEIANFLDDDIKLLQKKMLHLDSFSEAEIAEILDEGRVELLNFFGK